MTDPRRHRGRRTAPLLALLLGLGLAACEREPAPEPEEPPAAGETEGPAAREAEQEAPGEVVEIVVGLQSDRSGPTQSIGPYVAAGARDYIRLFNRRRSLGEGYRIRLLEIDHGYNVARGIEAYERFLEAGAVSVALFGTPHTFALTPRLRRDEIPGTSPGFGTAAAANGKVYPYLFPVAATYWSQGAAAVQFILERWRADGGEGAPRLAYLYYDNPAGREPLPILRELAGREGFTLQTYAVPPPGLEMRPQVQDIAETYRADWVITHLFGRAPGVSIQTFARAEFPRERIVTLSWGSAESDVAVAGWDRAEGYHGLQFTGVGHDFAVIRAIRQMYADRGEKPPEAMTVSAYYNRGVLTAALHARAIQLALEPLAEGEVPTGAQVKAGFESIREFDLGGFLPPLTITPADHEGGGWVKVYQVRDGGWAEASDWFRAYRDLVRKHVEAVEAPRGAADAGTEEDTAGE